MTILRRPPEETIRSYMEKVRADGLGGVAVLMHPEELDTFQKMMTPFIEEALKGRRGADDLRQVCRQRHRAPPQAARSPGVHDDFLPVHRGHSAAALAVLKTSTIEVPGHVKEGDTSHVVTRMRAKVEGMEIEKLSVMSGIIKAPPG